MTTPRRTAMPTQTNKDTPVDSGDNVTAVKGGKGKDQKGNTDKEGKGTGSPRANDPTKAKICPYHPLGTCHHNDTTRSVSAASSGSTKPHTPRRTWKTPGT